MIDLRPATDRTAAVIAALGDEHLALSGPVSRRRSASRPPDLPREDVLAGSVG